MRDPKFCFPCKSIFTNLLLLRQIELEEKKDSLSKKPSPIPIICSLLNVTVNPGLL